MRTTNSCFKSLLFALFSLCLVHISATFSIADTPRQITTPSRQPEQLAAIGVPDWSASDTAAALVIDPVRSPFDINPYII
ncbi:MAG TPA: hypothetical protein VKE41_19380 [Roseiflexaceae bacterium]|nr:hypothetical protein [Roseiflexaceae bacterium]